MNSQYFCPGCNRPLNSGHPKTNTSEWLEQRFWCKDDGGTATISHDRPTPRWYALVAVEFDKVSAMPLVIEPEQVESLWDQALAGAEATVMEPMEESSETNMQEAARRTALAVAILAYGETFFFTMASTEKRGEAVGITLDDIRAAEEEAGRTIAAYTPEDVEKIAEKIYRKRTFHDYLVARFDITDLTEDERGALATEITVQAEHSDLHPSVPNPELVWINDVLMQTRKMVDIVREAYMHDPTVSHEDYGRLMAEADDQDQRNEWAAEAAPSREE